MTMLHLSHQQNKNADFKFVEYHIINSQFILKSWNWKSKIEFLWSLLDAAHYVGLENIE